MLTAVRAPVSDQVRMGALIVGWARNCSIDDASVPKTMRRKPQPEPDLSKNTRTEDAPCRRLNTKSGGDSPNCLPQIPSLATRSPGCEHECAGTIRNAGNDAGRTSTLQQMRPTGDCGCRRLVLNGILNLNQRHSRSQEPDPEHLNSRNQETRAARMRQNETDLERRHARLLAVALGL